MAEDGALARDAVDVRSLDDVVDRGAAIEAAVATGVAAPVIGEDEENVGAGIGGAERAEGEEGEDEGGKNRAGVGAHGRTVAGERAGRQGREERIFGRKRRVHAVCSATSRCVVRGEPSPSK